MKKTKIIETTIREEEICEAEATYKYSLTMCESKRVASYRIPLYSVGIEMTTQEGKHTEAIARDIFADLGKAVVFFNKIIEARATPLNLYYIIEDGI